MTFVNSVEDALYAPDSIVTIAITHQWTRTTDMLVLVKNNATSVGEDITDVQVTMSEVEA